MGKRHPNLPAWQWRAYPNNHQHPTNLVLHLIAVPLFIVAFLLIVSGVFSLSLANIAIGVIGVIAALALQRHGHSMETQAAEPFSDRKDAVSRLLVEQFLTFPRFFLSGGWWRAVSATVVTDQANTVTVCRLMAINRPSALHIFAAACP